VDPSTAPRATDANLLQVSAPLKVKLDGGVDSSTQVAGQVVTGRLEEDLVEGGTVIAPAGSVVQAQLVPTSYWSDGGGDAYHLTATSITVGDTTMPVHATAVPMQGTPEVVGNAITVPQGTVVSFESDSDGGSGADEAALRSATASWVETWNTRNVDAHAALYSEDAVLLPPNQPAIFGRDAIRAATAEQMAEGVAIELEDLEIRVDGDSGYKAGRYRLRDAAGNLIDRGKYIEIWSRFGGQWLIHRDIWNSSLPAAVTAGDQTE
jgi:ketosteroid isomerase-like protein